MKILFLLIAIILSLVLATAGCRYDNKIPDNIPMSSPVTQFRPEIEITDAYCTENTVSKPGMFDFHFTVKNLINEEMDIRYYWTLNDPKADAPGSEQNINVPLARAYQGQIRGTLPASDTSDATYVTVNVEKTREYDPRYYVMYISAYRDETQIGYYSGQKSPADWDYGSFPPKPLNSITILPSPSSFLTNSENVSSQVLLKDAQVDKSISDKQYMNPWYPAHTVNIDESILLVSGSIQNKHPENKEIAIYAEGYDASGQQVSWTLDTAHIAGQIGLHLEKDEVGQFMLHLSAADKIKSISIFANSYPMTPP